MRKATTQEIKDTARRLLVAEGLSGVSVRAIAREMEMTAPAVYRYFDSHHTLIDALRADLYVEMAKVLAAAMAPVPADDVAARLIVISRELRRWALAHPHEFGLVLGNTPNLMESDHESGWDFSSLFVDLFVQLWQTKGFPVPPRDMLPPTLVKQLDSLRLRRQMGLPVQALFVVLRCWLRLYGVVSMEVLGHLRFALDDAEPFFERELYDLAQMLQVPYTAPYGCPMNCCEE